MKILEIIKAQKISGKVEVRRESKNKNDTSNDKKVEQNKFSLNEFKEQKSTYKIAKELKKEQVEDIMQYMQSQAIYKMAQINEL